MPLKIYQKNCDNIEALISVQQKKLKNIIVARIIAFIVLVLIISISIKLVSFYLLFLTLIPIVVFAFLVKRNEKEKTKLVLLNHKLALNTNEIDCLNGDFSMFENGKEFIDSNHEYSHDIDLFGTNSLFQYLNRTSSQTSKIKLANHLSFFETDKETLINRQQAISELSVKLKWRQEFGAKGKQYQTEAQQIKELVDWNPQEIDLFKNKKIWKIILIAVPVIAFISIVAYIYGLISGFILTAILLSPLSIVGKHIKTINAQHRKLSKFIEVLIQNNVLTELIESEKFESENLLSIQRKLLLKNKSASIEINKLALIAQQLDNRSNPVFAILMNSLFLWDLQYLFQLKNWLTSNSNELENWFEAVNDMEVISSLANFNYNHPEFITPVISQNKIISTQELGHPLLKVNSRVNNNFEIQNLQEFVIITGANMAGKSTFLRTIGVNLVLAMSGTSVCAKEFEFIPQPLFSSMRTSDSLSENESYFYSELKRLQFIVERLRKGEKLFIILDEILKGTNSKDKAEGSKKFVKQLIKHQAAGIIATHDLSLCSVKNDYPNQIENHYFDVEIENDNLVFDYKLKPGICSNMNAEFLMKKMGITE